MALLTRDAGRFERPPRPVRPSVQSVHVGVSAIESGAVRLTDGSSRAVLEVGGIDLAFQEPGAQEATLAGFAAFLNGLAYPVQILVRLVPADLEPYIGRLEDRGLRVLGGALADLALDHANFLRRLARSRALIQRRYYVVIPDEGVPTGVTADGPWSPWRWLGNLRRRTPAVSDAPRGAAVPAAPGHAPADPTLMQLQARCAEVARQLGRCALPAQRLDDAALAELLYSCWCPDLSRVQRLRQTLTDLTTPLVRGAA